jgi:lycopene beta-cyclase
MEIERLRSEIRQYAFNRGWQFKRLIREEVGCLPIPVAAAKRPSVGDPKILATGLRGGFFHPTTGRSFIEGLKLADALSKHELVNAAQIQELYWAYARHFQDSSSYFHLLNKTLFLGTKPQLRHRVFEHFYTMPGDFIDRFYSLGFATSDKWRLLMGRPPLLPNRFMLDSLGRHLKSEPHWSGADDAPLRS